MLFLCSGSKSMQDVRSSILKLLCFAIAEVFDFRESGGRGTSVVPGGFANRTLPDHKTAEKSSRSILRSQKFFGDKSRFVRPEGTPLRGRIDAEYCEIEEMPMANDWPRDEGFQSDRAPG